MMKALLVFALISFAIGFFEITIPHSWALGLPLGAVLLGFYIVLKIFAGESARFDEEQRLRNEQADRVATSAAKGN